MAQLITGKKITIKGLNAWYHSLRALTDINLVIEPNQVTAIIGPSGCGKSTLIRCINRLHEIIPGARVSGQVFLDGQDIYAPQVDPVEIRRRVGMVFQKPNPFPTMSTFDNVAAGIKLNSRRPKAEIADIVERSFRQAALWDEVKDKLHYPGIALSGGQQQRLCIARVLAVEPEVILMDEPCSALDPMATLKIEELLQELKRNYTIVIVTHNMQQAARVSDRTAFLLLGELIEYGPTRQVFSNPADKRTEAYVSGRFG